MVKAEKMCRLSQWQVQVSRFAVKRHRRKASTGVLEKGVCGSRTAAADRRGRSGVLDGEVAVLEW